MHIEIYYKGQTIKRHFVPDQYLRDEPDKTKEQNFYARKAIIDLQVKKVIHEYSDALENGNITIGLCFESKGFELEENRYKKAV